MIRFMKTENMDFIRKVIEEINNESKSLEWGFDVMDDLDNGISSIRMYWEYLEDEDIDYFEIIYDQKEDFFSVKDEHGEYITEELEDNTDLKRTMRSVFAYASSRY